MTKKVKSGKSRLFLVDGTALVYRSYFAFQSTPLTDSQGRNISAVFGFFSTLFSILEREQPEYLVIAFDTKAPTFRHSLYPEYKATRQKMAEDMIQQLPILDEVISASEIPVLQMEGFEADDLMGTAAKMAEQAGLEVMMVTGDKDFYQLVSDNVRVYNVKKGAAKAEILGAEEVKEKFGVLPEKVIDTLGLMGDTSDNVPGIYGVGEKTAVDLISRFGSIEGVYANLDQIKVATRVKVESGREAAFLSRKLVTIKTDCPLDFNLEGWKYQLNSKALREKLLELEFKSLLKYLGEAEVKIYERHYQLMDDAEKLSGLISDLKGQKIFALDTETTSQDPMRAELVGFSFSWEAGKAYYIPCNRFKLPDDELTFLQDYSWFGKEVSKSLQYILTQLQPLLEDSSLQKITQNGKYDMLVLRNYGIEVGGMVFDTMIAHYLLDPGARGHNLDDLALKYLKIEKIPTSDLIGSGAKQITMDQAPVERVADYACEDADCTYQLASILAPELEREGLDRLFHEVEIPLVEVLLTLERNGVALDQKLLADISADLGGQLLEIQKNIYHLAGAEFNLDSPKQLAHILFEKLNLPVQRKTKTGYSTDEGVLQKLAELDPVPKEILKYRTLAKLKNTYAEALPRLINPYTGRLHTSYNQTVAATGRLSSSDPNLQNIPVRTEMGGRIREAFVPGNAGWKLMSADYSQIELRILAHFTGDAGLLEAFRLGQDIHRQTASLIFNCPPELVTQEMRRAAKEVNFGVIYGMREFGLSERLGIPHKRAKEFIDNYFQSYPAVENFIQTTIEKAHTEGYVNTILGRKRPLPELKSPNHNLRQNAERMAVNTPIQGSAADMIKLAMIKLYGRMKQERVKSLMIMQVHDELVFEVPEEEMDLIKDMVIEEMENAMSLSVPIKVDASFGENWLQAH